MRDLLAYAAAGLLGWLVGHHQGTDITWVSAYRKTLAQRADAAGRAAAATARASIPPHPEWDWRSAPPPPARPAGPPVRDGGPAPSSP